MSQTGGRTSRLRRIALRLLAAGIVLGLVGLIALLQIDSTVVAAGEGRIETVASVPARRVAIVFGAGVYKDGRLSYPLRIRMRAALDLYESGKVKKILVSGDNRFEHYNEPQRMRDWLIEKGVPPEDIACDYAGRRTLDTCARAARLWKLDEVILVTQKYHLPRALYLAKAWGMDAVGVSADGPGGTARKRDRLRELIARVGAWVDVNVLDTQPALWGEPETI